MFSSSKVSEKGQGLAEYAIILSLVVIVVCCGLGILALFLGGPIVAALILFWEPIQLWLMRTWESAQAGNVGSALMLGGLVVLAFLLVRAFLRRLIPRARVTVTRVIRIK